MGTLGLALILLGLMAWRGAGRRRVRALPAAAELAAPLRDPRDEREPDADHRARARDRDHRRRRAIFLRVTKLGTAMRALANDREITATLGVPGAAGRGGGLVRLGPRLRRRRAAAPRPPHVARLLGLTFLVISSLAAALIGRLQSLWATLSAGSRSASPRRCSARTPSISAYRSAAPFVLAIVALLVPLAAPRRHDLAGDEPMSVDAPRAASAAADARGARRSSAGTLVRGAVVAASARSSRSFVAAGARRRGLDHDLHERRDLLGRRARASASSTAGSG